MVAGAALVLALSAAVAQAVFGSLAFVEQEKDGVGGVDGLAATDALAVSPDGANVYVAGQNDSAVAAFSREPATGGLTFIEFEQDGQNGVDGIAASAGVTVSPDGLSVYVSGANDNAVATFSREANGALDFVEFKKDGVGGVDGLASPRGVAVSPGGAHVYVASLSDAAVSSFARDPGNGTLTFIDIDKDGVGGVDGLAGASGLSISPDGANVYVTGANENAVAAFSRDPGTGMLTFVEVEKDGVDGVDGLAIPQDVAVSPDGANVYVTGTSDDAVATFSRDPTTGALTFVEQDTDGVGGVDGLNGAMGVAVSTDGRHAYVAGGSDNAVATFSRDPTTGALTFVEQDTDGVGGVDGLAGARFVTTSPDGAHVYVTGRNDNAVVAFAREGPPPVDPIDTELEGSASAKGKQKQEGSKIFVKVKVKAKEDLTAAASGKVRVGKRSYKLKPRTKTVSSGSSKTLKLKPKKSKEAKKIVKAMKKGKKAKAKLIVKLTDEAGNKKTEKLSIRLKR
ncbi:MAG: beta-propeller fold lactonase family protein [Solirubrobacterales bacterium]